MGQAILDLRFEISNWGKAHKFFKTPENQPDLRDPRSVSKQIRAFADEGFEAILGEIAACQTLGQRDKRDKGSRIGDCGLRKRRCHTGDSLFFFKKRVKFPEKGLELYDKQRLTRSSLRWNRPGTPPERGRNTGGTKRVLFGHVSAF